MSLLSLSSRYLVKLTTAIVFNVRNFTFLFQDSFKFPLVSIVVPLYNEERFVIHCLSSIKKQSYRNFECIIVNDCSTDNSMALVKQFIHSDERFKVIEHDINRGLSASRNTGLMNAAGEYITFLDSDDFLLSHSIWRRVYTLKNKGSDNDVGSYCSIFVVPESGSMHGVPYSRFQPPEDVGPWDFITCRGECPFPPLAPLMRTDILRKFGGFDESMRKGAEDWELWSRIMRCGYRFIPSGNFGGAYRQKPGSMVRAMPVYHVREAVKLIEKAYSRLHETEITKGVPYVFEEPIGHYDKAITKARRLIHYATMAYLNGDTKGFDEIVGYIEPCSGFYLERFVDIRDAVDEATARYYCMDMKAYKKRMKDFVPQINSICGAISERLHEYDRCGE